MGRPPAQGWGAEGTHVVLCVLHGCAHGSVGTCDQAWAGRMCRYALSVALGEVVGACVWDGPWSAGRGGVGASAELCTSESVCVHSCKMLGEGEASEKKYFIVYMCVEG